MEKLVDDFPHYKVTDDGRIFSRYSSRSSYVDAASPWTEIFPSKEKSSGYMVVTLVHKSFVKKKRVHRLIAEAFIPNPENKPYVNHIDGDKTNYHPSNLEWVSASENSIHAVATGLATNTYRASSTPCKCISAYGIETKYDSINEASRVTGVAASNISAVCNGKRKTAGGYRWEFDE